MSHNRFEVALVIEPIVDPFDARIDVAQESMGLVVSNSGSPTVATALVEAPDAVAAAMQAAHVLEVSGICVDRSYPDLVTRADIADRLAVTRQAVGNWIRGERRGDRPFPTPVHGAAGGLWLWRDVAEWSRGYSREDVLCASLDDHILIDSQLHRRKQAPRPQVAGTPL